MAISESVSKANWDRIFGKGVDTVECCGHCGLPVRNMPPDGISVCDDCGVVEGNTTQEELQ